MEKQLAVTHNNQAHFEGLIAQFVMQLDVTPGSRLTYKGSLRQFFGWMETQKIHDPTRESILAFKEALDARGLRPFTRAGYLVAVRRFFEWTEGMKLYPNIAKGVKGARRLVKTHQKNALTVAQIRTLLGTVQRNSLEGARNFALINLLIRTGLRLIEACRANIEDIELHPSGETLLWVRGKGRDGKDAFVVITEGASKPLQEYVKLRGRLNGKEPLFASASDRNFGKRLTTHSMSRLIKAHLRASGLDNRRMTAHSLRHTFGVMAITAGASLYEVQLAMRHTAPTTTEVYLGDIEQIKRFEGGPEKRINALLDPEE